MNDLLNEDEFLPKEYNPKRWFFGFYIVACILSVLFFFSVRFYRDYFTNTSATITVILGLLTPIISSMIMVFAKNDNTLKIRLKSAAYKIFLLFFFCYLSILLLGLFTTFKDRPPHISIVTGMAYTVFITAVLYTVLYLVTISIILPILKRAQRINKLSQ